MTRLFVALLALFLAGASVAQENSEAPIQGVIRSQIDAFLADDFDTAFSFASPMIRGIFQTPDNFGRMVREGYPMVWRPSDVAFGELREEDGKLFQRVEVTDGAGQSYALDYEMIETGEGWQINGVFLLRAEGIGV